MKILCWIGFIACGTIGGYLASTGSESSDTILITILLALGFFLLGIISLIWTWIDFFDD